MDSENFTAFYNEIISLRDEYIGAHEAWAAKMIEFIKEHKDNFCELKPELKPLDINPAGQLEA